MLESGHAYSRYRIFNGVLGPRNVHLNELNKSGKRIATLYVNEIRKHDENGVSITFTPPNMWADKIVIKYKKEEYSFLGKTISRKEYAKRIRQYERLKNSFML